MLLHCPCRDELKPPIEDVPLAVIEGFVSVLNDQPYGPPHVFGRQSVLDRFVYQAFLLETLAGPPVEGRDVIRTAPALELAHEQFLKRW